VQRHPDAEKLQIAEVSDGTKVYTVVCADLKCRGGMKTAFAQVGAVLTDADGLVRRIEKGKIRGVESEGMLCSGSELRISEDCGGILDLPMEMETGRDLTGFLWDPVFELSLTPNLGHCMSALGVARELSAALEIPIHRPKVALKEGKAHLDKEVSVKDFSLCSRYMCRLIEGVKVGPSPFWLKKQLEACGQKSINNVVDIANYIMLKVGQPLHAFDADLLEGKTLSVEPAKTACKFTGLDGVEREVPTGALLIADAHKPVAIAGIMGGANSSVSDQTTRILLEAACFNSGSIRATTKKISLRTESSQRFEKGVDPVGVAEALNEACQLILDLCGGELAKGTVDLKKGSFEPKKIGYRAERTNQIIGTKLSITEIEEIFHRLGFKAKEGVAEVPLYRTDISEEIDLIEEVARIYGYNNIEKTIPRCTTSQIPNDPVFVFETELRRRLVGLGLQEFLTCDLIGPKLAEISRAITPADMGFLKATYSKSEDYSILRTSLLPGLLQVVKGNLAQKNQTLTAFEIGRIHFQNRDQVVEIPMGAILLTGKAELPHWSHKTADVDFFDLKGLIENLCTATFQPSSHLSFHPGRQADIHLGDLIVGSLGEVHPLVLEKFGIDQRVFYAELNMLHLMAQKKGHHKIAPLPQFPSSERDWTIPLDSKMAIAALSEAIDSFGSPLLERMELIDLYIPEAAEKKNATFRFTYRDRLKTISFEEVEAEHAKMIDHVAKLLAK